MQYYDITIAANGQQLVEAPGSFLYYLTGNAGGNDNTIKVTLGLGGTSVLLKPGQSIRLPANAMPIDTWRIENYANAQTILGQVLVGMGDFHDSSVTGTVQVVDNGKALTLGSAAYQSHIFTSPSAGNYASAQVWNPANSGQRCVVKKAIFSAGAAVAISVGLMNSQLATPYGTANPQSKLGGGANPLQLQLTGNTVAKPMTNVLLSQYAQASQALPYEWKEPIVLPPGWGVTFQAETTNTSFTVDTEYVIEANI